MMKDRFEVPNILRKDLLMLCYRGDDKAEEALQIIKAQIKPILSRVEEKELASLVRKLHLQFIHRRMGKNRNGGVNTYIKKDANWLSIPLKLPIQFKFDKLPPPREEGESEDSLNFRKPSNYCFMCSSKEVGDCPPHLTGRLSKSLSVALKLGLSNEGMDYVGNLLGCVVCSPCYEKVLEVDDGVKELELIETNLQKMARELDEILSDGIQNHKHVYVEIHGVPPTYLTPVELRREIIDTRKRERAPSKTKTKSTVPTRRSKFITNNPHPSELDSFCPQIISVNSLAPSNESNVDAGDTTQVRWEESENGDTTGTIVVRPTLTNVRRAVGRNGRSLPSILRRKKVTRPVQIPCGEVHQFPALDQKYSSKIEISNDTEERDPLAVEVDAIGAQLDLPIDTSEFPVPQSKTKGVEATFVGSTLPPSIQPDFWKKSKRSGKQLPTKLIVKKKKVAPALLGRHFELLCPVPDCGYRCNEGDRLQGHVNGVHHNEPRPFKCNYAGCPKRYSSYRNLTKHHKFSHGFLGKGNRPFPCDQCSRAYLNASHLRDHQEEVHSSINLALPCPTCAKVFKTSRRLRGHIRIHLTPELKCPSTSGCSASFKNFLSLKAHQGKSHPIEFRDCVTTEKEVQKKNVDRVELICEECGKMMRSLRMMRTHLIKQHKGGLGPDGKPLQKKKNLRKCHQPGCPFKSTDTVEMKRHKLSHGVVIPTIPCSQPNCSKMFLSKEARKNHERLKHDEHNRKNLKCERCGKEGFTSQNLLGRHFEICKTGGRKEIPCESCNMKFSIVQNLIRHQTLHPNCKPKEVGLRSVYCGTCGALCSSNNSLARHVQLIHNEGSKPFQCSSCPKAFPIKMYLTRHLKESKYCPGSRGYISSTINSYSTPPPTSGQLEKE